MSLTHPELVSALVKPGHVIATQMTAAEADLWHAATGVCGETTEILDAVQTSNMHDTPLDLENMIEELGDMEFYLEQTRQNLGVAREETLGYVRDRPAFLLVRECGFLTIAGGNLLDLAKKVAIYKQAPDREKFIVALSSIEREMDNIRFFVGVTRDETLAGNIAKLSVRYASLSYSDDAAQTRADKA